MGLQHRPSLPADIKACHHGKKCERFPWDVVQQVVKWLFFFSKLEPGKRTATKLRLQFEAATVDSSCLNPCSNSEAKILAHVLTVWLTVKVYLFKLLFTMTSRLFLVGLHLQGPSLKGLHFATCPGASWSRRASGSRSWNMMVSCLVDFSGM